MFCIRRHRWFVTAVCVIPLALLSWSDLARADAVLDWHEIAVNTISTASPVVQAAVYDAVQAIDGKFKPYHVQIAEASGSPEAAAAKAAHDVLVSIFPAQGASLDATYLDYLAKKRLGRERSQDRRGTDGRRRYPCSAGQ